MSTATFCQGAPRSIASAQSQPHAMLPRSASSAATSSSEEWNFIVSGDSRDCGDLVMPAIASGVGTFVNNRLRSRLRAPSSRRSCVDDYPHLHEILIRRTDRFCLALSSFKERLNSLPFRYPGRRNHSATNAA